jgi:hypothetical protein
MAWCCPCLDSRAYDSVPSQPDDVLCIKAPHSDGDISAAYRRYVKSDERASWSWRPRSDSDDHDDSAVFWTSADYDRSTYTPPAGIKSCLERTRAGLGTRCTFDASVKTYDYLEPLNNFYNRTMIHILDTGGFATAEECLEFFQSTGTALGLDYVDALPQVEALFIDFKTRLLEAVEADPDTSGVFILPGGGGTNAKVHDGSLININHMLIVFFHAKLALSSKTKE